MKIQFALTLATLAASATSIADVDIPEPGINAEQVTVSGISSGGAMAQQLHMAYPDLFSGAGIIAGVPRGCAGGDLKTALAGCMAQPGETLDAETLAKALKADAKAGRVGDPALLADDRAWTFHGRLDTAVAEPVAEATAKLYRQFMAPEQVTWIADVEAAHTFPTVDQGSACDEMAAPFVAACDYDAAGEMLGFLYPGLAEPAETGATTLLETTLPGATGAGLAETGWLYIPETCPAGGCRLHLVLHGCGQSATQVGQAFAEKAGYLRWASANGIVLAFPQVVPAATNPLACWDWWGYTGANYMTRDGAQMEVLSSWLQGMVTP